MTELKTTAEKLNYLQQVVSSKRFLSKDGTGNDVPFFIFPYSQKDALEVADGIKRIMNILEHEKINVCEINLYWLCIEILKKKGLFERLMSAEGKLSAGDKSRFKANLQGPLDPEKYLTPAISEKVRTFEEEGQCQCQIVFLTGVAEVFPYIRSHTILNNLLTVIKTIPMVLFFPGEYSYSQSEGTALKLFNRLPLDRYYRAFNILEYSI